MKSILFIKRKVFTHIVAWMGYFVFWFLQFNIGRTDAFTCFQFTFLQMLFHIVLVYSNNYYLIPNYLYKQRFIAYMVFYLSISMVIGISNYYLNEYIFDNINQLLYGYRDVYEGLTVGVLSAIFVTSIPAWYKVNSDKLKSDNDAKQLMNDKIQEELKFLKAQINPHFLFNSLNTVFNLIDTNKEDAKKTLVQFSEILRFQLYEAGNNTISLAKEMEYINSYAAIEKIRKGDALHVTILEHTDYPVEVPPLLLLTFVENAFKHVSNLDKGNYIIIEVKAQINSFEFTIKNSIDHYQRTYEVSQNSGIGLKNIKRRLNLLYADRHQLEIKTNERSFEVHLKITFDEKN